MRFNQADCETLQQLVFDQTAQPSFELLKTCLVWDDERPAQISKAGYELLGDLWIVRGYMHRNVPVDQWGLDPAYFQGVWTQALHDVPNWPGFKRLVLSERDNEYLANCIGQAASDDY